MPGGFHPFHAGHMALYNSAREAFPDAEVFVAATNDTKTRPFPFALKEKLAKVAGVQPGHFVQVKSPFQPKEITQNYNPDEDVVIFVRSQKDMKESPIPGGVKKNGEPAYFQPFKRGELESFGKHAYMAYLPTVEFGPGITSATEIRNAWPKLDDKRKTAMVMSLYPATQKNPKLAANVVQMLDMGMGDELTEGDVIPFKNKVDDLDDDNWIPSIEDFEQEERIKNRKRHADNDIDENFISMAPQAVAEATGDIYSSRQIGDIANDLGNGYVLVDDSYDDDDGFVKAMYGVYHQEDEDQYRFVGWVNTRSSYRYTQEEFNQAVQDLVDNDQKNLNEYNVRKTKKFIQRAHDKEQGQMYGSQPYSSHPKAVAAIGKKFFGPKFDSEAVKVALLHDVLEDTPYTPEQLSQKGFSDEVIKAVQLLTKNKAMSYADNIRTIINSGNKLAMMVKYCDNYMNYTGDKSHWSSEKAERSQKKYLASLNMLGDVLGIKKHVGDEATNVTESTDYLEEK